MRLIEAGPPTRSTVLVVRNIAALVVMCSAVNFLTPTRQIRAQATQSCQQPFNACAGTANENKEACDNNCNGEAACLATCEDHHEAAMEACQGQYNNCVTTQTANCQAAANGTCGLNNSPIGVTYDPNTGYCSFTCSCPPSGRPTYCPGGPNAAACGSGGGWYCDSPVLIDTASDGFDLTPPEDGVLFDLHGGGDLRRWSWTQAEDDDAWLVLDRNGNKVIDNGVELFGSATPQAEAPPGVIRNGFRALAVFDVLENGGNDDGVIDVDDAVFASLRLWRDLNHNGTTERGELSRLPAMDIGRLDLAYQEKRRIDEHGNTFLYRGRVWDTTGRRNKWAWDVFLTSAQ